jgi:hypothetical protein
LLRLPATWQAPALERVFSEPARVEEVEALHTDLLPRLSGELVHLGLKLLVERGAAWLPSLERAPYWRKTLAPLCVDAAALQTALGRIRAQLEACVRDPQTAWLFQGNLSDDACELALVDYSGGYRRDHIVDRTFVDSSGLRWIIDYKSGSPASGQSEDAFIAEQSALYRDQLARYATLFRARGDEHPRCALLFTALPRLVTETGL